MTVSYACKCRNVRVAATRQAALHAPADLTPTFTLHEMIQRDGLSLQCLVCGQIVQKGMDSGQVEVLAAAVSPDDEPSTSNSVLPLDLSSFSTSSADVYPSTPLPPAASRVPPVSSLLPPLPDPLFLPPPFTPSHPHFISVSSLASEQLAIKRSALEDEIAAFIKQKQAALARAEQDVRREVMVVWEAYKGHASPSRAASPPAFTSRSPSAAQVVARDTGFSAGSRGSLNLERRAESKSSSPNSLLVGVPQTTAFAKVSTPTGSPPTLGGQASLLGASLARSSYMPSASPTSMTSSPGAAAVGRSPLSPVPSQPSNTGSYAASSIPNSIPTPKHERNPSNQDLDLATSMRFSHLPSPPNLIFSTTNARAGATLVLEGDDVRSKSWEERAALLAQQPVVLTPPVEEAEGPAGGEGGEQDVAFRESPSAAAAADAEAKDGKKEGTTPKRVTFKDDAALPAEDDEGDDEEEGTVVGEQDDVFDFEPHSQPSSSSSPPTSPTVAESSSSSLLRSTARPLERPPVGIEEPAGSDKGKEPMYTLDGRSINPVLPSSLSPGRGLSAERPRTEDDDEENKVLVSMRRLTAADLPSHRASHKDTLANGVRKWAMYGRVSNSRSPSSSRDPDEAAYQGGQSLPIPLAFPPSASLTTAPLERKTSLSDRQLYVPPLRPAMRSAGSSSTSTSGAASRSSPQQQQQQSTSYAYSQSVGASMDPGPMFDEDDGSESSSGFVAPHLKAMEGGRSGDAVGWASMVHR